MKFSEMIRRYGAYVVALLVFVLVAVIYCIPVQNGKVLYAGDIQNYVGVSRESIEYTENTGDFSFWNGSLFSGMPNYQIGGGFYQSDRLLGPISNALSHRGNPVLMILLYLICFYIMFRSFEVGRWLSIAAALATALSSYFLVIIPAGHFTKINTIAFCGVILGGFNLIFNKKYLWGASLTILFVALGFKPHPQMFYYFFMLIGVLWISQAWGHIKAKKYKELIAATVIFVLSVAIGIGTGTGNVFANAEYVSETMRGGHSDIISEGGESPDAVQSKGLDIEYATQWSYGIDETMSFMIPGFMGGANSIDVGKDSGLYKTLLSNGVAPKSALDFCKAVPMYWGDQPFTAGNVYMGAIVCFLFLLGLLIVKGPYKWALLAATLFSTALAWGHNFMWLTEFFFKYFPLYSKFRAVSSILVVAEVAMPLLGFMAIKQIMDGAVEKKDLFKSLYISAGITAGICLVFALLGGSLFSFVSQYDASWSSGLPDWLYAAIIDERASLLRSDSFRSFLFIAAAFGLLWIYSNGKLKNSWFIAILSVLVIADMWPVDKRYFNDSNFVSPKQSGDASFVMQDYEKAILQDDSYFRVFNLTTDPWSDSRTSYYLKSIGGYSAAKLRRYQDLIDQHLSKLHWPVIGMLNAKYIIVPDENGAPVPQINPYALGNAWFVDRLVVADNANQESDALNSLDLSHEAVLDKEFSAFLPEYSPSIPQDASVVLNSYTPKELDYTYSTSQPGTVVFSEIYYPYGWKATIDGQPVGHYRVNYMLRALNVPAGEHNIHFLFDPDSVRKGNTISVICIIIMYLLILGSVAYDVIGLLRKRNSDVK